MSMATDKLKNSELIQSIIRLCIGALTYFYINAGIDSGYFNTSHQLLNNYSLLFFGYTFINLLSIFWLPVCQPRRYAALGFDIANATFASYLTGGINSVYVLVYLWIYIGYGTRYGLRFLGTAVLLALIGYNILLLTEDDWHLLTLEAVAFLLLIIALPIYMYSLQKKLIQSAESERLANEIKTEFLSNMTHQIRTPISGIVGMINLLSKTELSQQQKLYLQALSQSSYSLQDIIDDVIDFSRIEKGDISFNHSVTRPRLLIDGLIHSLAPLSYERNVELSCYIDSSFPDKIQVDAQRFRQLLSNLIRYAIDHSVEQNIHVNAYANQPASGQSVSAIIDIEYEQKPQADMLTSNKIPDSNDALPLRISYQLTRLMNGIFEIQYRSDKQLRFRLHFHWQQLEKNPQSVDPEIAGKRVLIHEDNDINRNVCDKYCQLLGLETYVTSGQDNLIAHLIWSKQKNKPFDAIILCEDRQYKNVRELIMRIRSEAKYNAPIIFASYLHNLEQADTENLPETTEQIVKPVSLDILRNSLRSALRKKTAQTMIEPSSTPVEHKAALNILVVEDNEINASVVYSMLAEMGHKVDIATDGNTALYAMNHHPYDLVFMDLHMPQLDGIETTRQWRRLEKGLKHLPIIALTAKATANDRTLSLAAGMDDFITKPVDQARLQSILQSYT
jgi:two-component system sensor histidine kinase RpfC